MENDDRKQAPKRSPLPPAVQLDQLDSDLAMAITMQERERANFGSSGPGQTLVEEDVDEEEEEEEEEDDESDVTWGASEDGNEYEYLEGYAEAEYLEEAASNDDEEMEGDEIDPDELSYEELLALGEAIGEAKRGLSATEIDSCLFHCKFTEETGADRCVVCQVELEKGEDLVGLCPCKHCYHPDCIRKWLQIRKSCPICSIEVEKSNTKNV